MGPINYGGLQSPNNVIQQAMSGYKAGTGLRADKQAQEAQVLQQQKAKAMQADLANLANNPNAGAQDYSQMMVKHPALREHLTKSYEFLDKDAKANNMKFATELYASIYTGSIDVAKGMLERRKEAAKNAGDEKEFASASAIEKILDANPNAAETTMGLVLAGISGDDTFATIQEKLEKVKKTRAETTTIDATREADIDTIVAQAQQRRAAAGASGAAAGLSRSQTATADATRAAEVDTIVAQAMQRRSAGQASLASARKSDMEGLRVSALLGGELDQQLLDQGLTAAEIRTEKEKAKQQQAGTVKIETETEEVKAKIDERNALLSGKLDQQLLDKGKTQAEIDKLKVQAKEEQSKIARRHALLKGELDQQLLNAGLTKAEIEEIKTLTPLKADQYITQTAEAQSKINEREALLSGKLDQQLLNQGKTREEIAKLKVQAQQEQARTVKIRAETDEVKTLTPLKAGKYRAEVAEVQSKIDEREKLLSGKLDQQLLNQKKSKAEITKLKIEARKQEKMISKVAADITKALADTQRSRAATAAISSREAREKRLEPKLLAQHAANLGLTKARTNSAIRAAAKTNFGIQKLTLDIENAKDIKSGKIPKSKMFETEKKLRDEYIKNTGEFTSTQDAYRKIAAAEDTAPGDISLIFSYMKMLDPTSVVREGEFATAQNAAGIPDRILNLYNKARTGQRLGEKQVQEFKSQAKALMNASQVREKEIRDGLSTVIGNYKLNPDNVFVGKPSGDTEVQLPSDDVTTLTAPSPSSDLSDEDLLSKYLN